MLFMSHLMANCVKHLHNNACFPMLKIVLNQMNQYSAERVNKYLV